MAVNRETLHLLDGMRVSINGHVDHVERSLIAAWGRAWNEVAGEWDAAIQDVITASKDGKWPSPTQIRRARRAAHALAVTRDRLQGLVHDLPVTVAQVLPNLTDDTIHWSQRIIGSQLPQTATVAGMLGKVDPDALDAIVKRTTEQVTALSRPLSAQAEAAMRGALIKGIAIGDNPRKVAADMLARVHGQFEGGLVRSLVIARTEMLDAHRGASRLHDEANADVLQGWQWGSTLDRRTCPGCWGMHGTIHGLSEPGPIDHQQGRCVRIPKVKSWADLGFDVDEPASDLPDAEKVFSALSPEDQEAIMGKQRLALLQSGDVAWSDLATRRTTKGWRDSMVPTPVSDLAA